MYTWIENTFGFSDGLARGLAFAISLAVVLALFALFVLIIKRLAGGRVSSVRSRQPRLAIMDSTNIDTRRRLILVRRDNIEHLILVGGPSDVVVEQGIVRGTPLTAGHPRLQPTLQNGNGHLANAEGLTAPAAPTDTQFPHEPQVIPSAPAPGPATAETSARASAPADTPAPKPIAPAPSPSRTLGTTPTAAASLRSRISELQKAPARSEEKRSIRPLRAEAAISALTKPAPKETASDKPARETSAPTVQSPRPLQASSSQPANTQTKTAAAKDTVVGFAQAIARPLQERSSSSRIASTLRSVTPPSSGPAAKALTAFPLGAPGGRKEPPLGGDQAPKEETEVKLDTEAAEEKTTPQITAPQTKTQATVQTVETPKAEAVTEQPKSDVKPSLQPDINKRPDEGSETPAVKQEAAPAETANGDDKPAESGTAEKATTVSAQTDEKVETVGEENKQEPTNADTSAVAEEKASDEPKTAADKTPEHNPIEDEMAKLLDEVHGIQKA